LQISFRNPQNLPFLSGSCSETEVSEQLYSIDEGIDSVWDMPKEYIQILQGWRKEAPGTFFSQAFKMRPY
jgi:hypothetical protein